MNSIELQGSYYLPTPHYESNAGEFALHRHESGDKDILVVEDEETLCNLLAEVLEAEGYTTRKAANGLAALHQLEKARPNLILLDMMMPVMDGWQLIEHMRGNSAWHSIPVVLITAVYDMSSLESQTGARAILTKPFDIDLIVDAVVLYAD